MANVVEPRITLELLQTYYHLPLVDVAKELNVSLTMLKKICRKLNIQRWPHRQVRSINNSIQELKERRINTQEEHADVEAQIKLLEKKKRLVSRGASSGLQSALRNVLFLASPEDIEEETVDDLLSNLQKVVVPNSKPGPAGKKGKIPLLKMVIGSSTNGQAGQPTMKKTSLSTLQPPVAFEPAYQSPAMANVRLHHHRQRERELQQQQEQQEEYDDHDHEANNNYHQQQQQHQQQHDDDYEEPQPQDHYAWQMLLKQQQQQQREHHQKQRQQHEQRQQQQQEGSYPEDSLRRFGNGQPAPRAAMSLIHGDSRQQGGHGTAVVKSEPMMVQQYPQRARSLPRPDEHWQDEMGMNVLQSAAVAAAAANNECLVPASLRTGRGFFPPPQYHHDDQAYATEDAGWYYQHRQQQPPQQQIQHPFELAAQQPHAHSAIHRQHHLQMRSQLMHRDGLPCHEGHLGHDY